MVLLIILLVFVLLAIYQCPQTALRRVRLNTPIFELAVPLQNVSVDATGMYANVRVPLHSMRLGPPHVLEIPISGVFVKVAILPTNLVAVTDKTATVRVPATCVRFVQNGMVHIDLINMTG